MKEYFLVYSSPKPYEGQSFPIPEAIYNLIHEETNFGFALGQSIKDNYGYLFGIYDDQNKKFRAFKTLPMNATYDQVRKVLVDIYQGKYESFDFDRDGGGTDVGVPATSVIPINLGDTQSGGLIPLDLLPEWLRKLLDNFLGSFGAKIPWWVYAAFAGYTTTKTVQKNSNKIIWGGLTAFALLVALRKYQQKKKENKNA